MEQHGEAVASSRSNLTARIAARVRALRSEAGWSARQLAELCAQAGMPSLTRSTIAKFESGVRARMTVEELDVLAGVLGVSVEFLVRQEDDAVSAETPHRRVKELFVGRHAEVERLLRLLAQAKNNEPSVVFLSGDAGVGKTRLVTEFARVAESQRARVLTGSCLELSGDGAIPYGPLVEALRLFTRREGPDAARQLAGRSWQVLDTLLSDPHEAASPAVGTQPQMRIFGAVLRLADSLGHSGPLVLVLEDIHWADVSTLDLIRYLVKAKSDQRLMVVCSFRPVASRHRLRVLLGDKDIRQRVQEIALEPFDRVETRDFVTALAGRSILDDRVSRYFELSEGNAYFVEQLVGADDLSSPEVEVPQSLREVMLTRLGQLSDDAADVVSIAAVAGRRVGDSLLGAMTELAERDLERALLECVRQRILVHDATHDAYTFQHALLRDTAYQALVPRMRRRLHAQIARAMSAEPGSATRLLPELTHHWFEAGRLPEAFAASIRAAGQAVRIHAFPEAETQYERALKLWHEVAGAEALAGMPRERLLGLAADAARWGSRVTRALEWVREAMEEVDPAADPGRAGELQERLGGYLWQAGDYEAAARAYTQAAELLAGLPASGVASRVRSALATAAARAGDYDQARSHAQLAVDLARAVGARAEEGRARNSLGLALALTGHIDEGETELRAALAIAAEADHLEDLFRAYGNLGVCLAEAGRSPAAVAVLQEGLDRARDYGLLGTRQSDLLANNAAVALSALARYREAAELLDSILLHRPIAESLYARLTRAEIYVAQGYFAEAERLLDQVRTRADIDPRFAMSLFACLAEAAAWQGNLDQAREVVVRGLAVLTDAASARLVIQLCAVGFRIAADLRDREWAGDLVGALRRMGVQRPRQAPPSGDETDLLTWQCFAELERAAGTDRAETWAELAAGWDSLDRPFRRAYAQGRLAAAAARARSREQAVKAAREALQTAEAIGAKPLCQQLEALAREWRLWSGRPRPFNLTDRELQVLEELQRGATNAEVAERLSVAVNTVGVHIGNILRKLGARNRSEAAAIARTRIFKEP